MLVRHLRGPLLRSVSRSFYLSIRLLPAQLRDPVALAYLLARATDTIADTPEVDPAVRTEQLQILRNVIQGVLPHEAIASMRQSFLPLQANASERALIEALPQCLKWLDGLDGNDRAEVRSVLEKINQGQALDVERFKDRNQVTALATADDLLHYTYLVAGCVGEFWTRLCSRHLAHFSQKSEAEMLVLGKNYGVGLQLINILRDAGNDLRDGRCYFPQDELEAAGISSPSQILQESGRFAPVYAKWVEEAQNGIDAGVKYSLAIGSRRVRGGTVLPALIGNRTLKLLRDTPVNALRAKLKISRKQVRGIGAVMAITLADRAAIERLYGRPM